MYSLQDHVFCVGDTTTILQSPMSMHICLSQGGYLWKRKGVRTTPGARLFVGRNIAGMAMACHGARSSRKNTHSLASAKQELHKTTEKKSGRSVLDSRMGVVTNGVPYSAFVALP